MAITINVGKVKAFRGKQIEDMKNLDVREFAKYLNSRERRTVLRSFSLIEKFIEKSRKDVAKGKMPKTQTREIPIVPVMLGWTIGVHNGKEYTQVKVVEEMLGHRLGEFAQTRRTVKHGAAGIGSTKSSTGAVK
ncbi:MAG: ribosomal protein S19 family protein [archaeon]